MKKVYQITDENGRAMSATLEDGHLKVIMNFSVEKHLTMEEVCETIGWNIIEETEIDKPKVVSFNGKG